MGFRMSRSMLEGTLKQAYHTCVKHTSLDLGHALLTHHEAPRIHSRVSPGGLLGTSWGLTWAIWEQSGGPVGAFSGPHGNLLEIQKHVWEEQSNNTFNLSRFHHKSLSFNLAWRNARSRLNIPCFGASVPSQSMQPLCFTHDSPCLFLPCHVCMFTTVHISSILRISVALVRHVVLVSLPSDLFKCSAHPAEPYAP